MMSAASRATIYADIPGFRKSASLDKIRKHGHVLTRGRYVGAGASPEDSEPFDHKIRRLTDELKDKLAESRKLDAAIEDILRELGYGE